MKRSFVVAALMLMGAFVANAQTAQDLAAKYNEAMQKAQAKEYVAAATLLEEVVAQGESLADAAETVGKAKEMLTQVYFVYGGTLARAQKFDEALPYLEKAAAAGDQRANAYIVQINNALGAAAWNGGDFAKAAELFAKAHAVAPEDAKISAQLAESYAKIKEYDKSFELFRALTAAGDASAKERQAFYMLFQANELQSDEPARALALLGESIELNGDPKAYMLLMNIASKTNDYAKLIEFGERAAEAQTDASDKSTAYSMLGLAYEKQGRKNEAIAAYRKVVAGPNAAAAKAQVAALQAQ